MELSKEKLLEMYREMWTIRLFEEALAAAYMEGKTPAFDIGSGPVPGEMHLAAGQEPVAVGTCMHLTENDSVVGTHRPHHFAIAKKVPLNALAAEIFGKETGLGRGKGGHMHLFDPAHKFSCSGIIGASFPPACGAALAAKKMGKDWVAVAFAGDGAANQGSFHEALNLAAIWNLPVIFVIEDNSWAISVPRSKSTAVADNSQRAIGYGMPGVRVNDNDVLAVYEVVGEAVARARRGEGPSLIEVKTDRYFGHFQGDAEGYRPPEEVETLKSNDPIIRLGSQILTQGVATQAELDAARDAAAKDVEDAIEYARQSPYPAPEAALQHVFV
ncbi:MAG: thiamine pyrophosphate-dependent dehydrogenase E1 component subunit alpha [Anaerolineae bacterium]